MRFIPVFIGGIVSAIALIYLITGVMPRFINEALGAPDTQVTFQKNVIPFADSLYTLGTTTKAWLNVFTDELCLAGDCKTAWPAGGAGGGSGTVLYVQNGGATQNTGTTTLNFTPNSFTLVESPADTFAIRVATTTLGLLTTDITEGSKLFYTDARVSSYMSASSTYSNLLSFYTTPSGRITAGTGIDWSGNTLNGVYTAGDAITLTGEDFDFDGGTVPAGALGGTWASPTVDDDGHNHTSATLSGIDISADTNLSADGTEIVLTGDALSLGNALTYTNGTSTNFAVSTSLNLFGGGSKTTANALCIQLTGDAGLCDGSDATGGGGAGVRTYSMIVDADGAGDYTTIQGALDACGTSGGGSIYLSDPYYYIGGTGLTFKSNDCQVYGIYASTTIEIAGATTAFKTNSPAGTYANVGVHNVVIVGDGTAGSVGIDMSDMIRSRYTGIIMDNVDIGFKLNDTQNVTFYNTVRDFAITTLGSYGIYASSTNPTNDNKFSDGFIGCTAGCTGIHLNNAQANSFTNLSIEPGSTVGTIGVKLEVSTGASNSGTFANKFTNLYAEANGIGIYASSTIGTKEVEGNTFDGGQIVANTIDVIDRSNNGGAVQFNGTIVNYNINNTFATTTISSVVATLGTFTNTVVSTLATFLNVVVTGLLDVGAGVLEIPNGSAPTVDSIGELAIDSTSNQLVLYGSEKKVIGNGNIYSSFTYATSTAWTGTTTIPLGTAYVAETWNGIQCFTDAGTLNVSVSDGTNRMNSNNASTTVGTTVFTTNNTFTANEKRYVDVGTPASSPKKISCTISKSITAD